MEDCKLIKLRNSDKYAIVDSDDYEKLLAYNWAYHYSGYATYSKYLGGGRANPKHKHMVMHREIIHIPDGYVCDHINGNRLDNRKSNLRAATRSQNGINSKAQKNNTSGFKGVNKKKWSTGYKWCARIMKNRKMIQIGYFNTAEDAAIAYNEKALELFGEFAYLNQIPTQHYVKSILAEARRAE